MDPELQKQIAEYLKQLAESAGAGTQFAIEQAPLLVQERIAYGRIVETMELVGCIAFVGLCLFGFVLALRNGRETGYSGFDGEPAIVITAGATLACLGSIALCVDSASEAALVWFAPRVYVMEWVSSLVR